jgi:hypothetical protein
MCLGSLRTNRPGPRAASRGQQARPSYYFRDSSRGAKILRGRSHALEESRKTKGKNQKAGDFYHFPFDLSLRARVGCGHQPALKDGGVDQFEDAAVGLCGWLSGGDRYGVLFGISPKFRLW